jgi:hypothetical protein
MKALKYSYTSKSSAKLLYNTHINDNWTELTIPSEAEAMQRRLRYVVARDRVILVNAFNVPLMLAPNNTLYIAGLNSPPAKPSVGVAGGADGDGIFYTTQVHKIGDVELTESAPSPASVTVANSEGATRTWTISGNRLDKRATHQRLYASIAGNDPRMVGEYIYTTNNPVEAVPTLQFGKVMNEDLGRPPAATLVEFFKERVWYAGDPAYPDRIYFSELGQPEGVGGLSWVRTTTRYPCTGLKRLGDRLLVFTMDGLDCIVGDAPNIEVYQISPNIGCIAPDSLVQIFDRVYFASKAGIYSYNGSFQLLTPFHKEYWKTSYQANRQAYHNACAEDDIENFAYLLSIPGSSTFRWRLCYLPFEQAVGGNNAPPYVSFDRVFRPEFSLRNITGKLYSGSDDGYVRQQNVAADANDDSDSPDFATTWPDGSYRGPKVVTIITKHYLMDDPDGSKPEAKAFVRFWSFVQCENIGWEVKFYGGDEVAINQASGNVAKDTVSASLSGTKVAKTVHEHPTTRSGGNHPSGRGITLKYTFGGITGVNTGPTSLRWRGFGGVYIPGKAVRGDTV